MSHYVHFVEFDHFNHESHIVATHKCGGDELDILAERAVKMFEFHTTEYGSPITYFVVEQSPADMLNDLYSVGVVTGGSVQYRRVVRALNPLNAAQLAHIGTTDF